MTIRCLTMLLMETITDPYYLLLRQRSREALARFGIPSNPGFTDYNIVSGLRRATCLEPVEPWDEFDATSGKIFHDHLAVTLEELGIEVDKESLPVDMGLNLIP